MAHEKATCANCSGALYRVVGFSRWYHADTRTSFCTPADPSEIRTDWRTARVAAGGADA